VKRIAATFALLFATLLPLLAVGSAHAAAVDTVSHDTVHSADASPAGIQDTCDFGLCGHVYNDDDFYVLKITNHWPGRSDSGTWRWLLPGQSYGGRGGTEDADGLFVPSGCTATIAFVQKLGGPAWYRVYNGQHIHVTDISC
jgi:hypothetical protein